MILTFRRIPASASGASTCLNPKKMYVRFNQRTSPFLILPSSQKTVQITSPDSTFQLFSNGAVIGLKRLGQPEALVLRHCSYGEVSSSLHIIFLTHEALFISIYTRKLSVLGELVAETRARYGKISKEQITIYSMDANFYGSTPWGSPKTRLHRALDSVILDGGMMDNLVADASEFFEMQNWYREIGVPHRRGYLLHGPPGCGKTSTVCAIAGALGLEIYALSLSSRSWVILCFTSEASCLRLSS